MSQLPPSSPAPLMDQDRLATGRPAPLLTFLVPAHNERESLPVLIGEMRAAGVRYGRPFEILVVDDASDDGSAEWLAEEATRGQDLRVFRRARRGGQSAAFVDGIHASRGEVIVTLDGDLQNDPADLPALLDALQTCDLVCGVRAKRRDTWCKRAAARLANWFRRFMLGDRFRDVGCSLKAWRRAVAEEIPEFDGFHRYVPIFAEAHGFRVKEVPVSHRPLTHGRTHYTNLGRGARGIRDLFGVRWLLKRRVTSAEPRE
ncbi:MAG: glycosyltransferase family 2 protein [Planctomycetaceae bacterium]